MILLTYDLHPDGQSEVKKILIQQFRYRRCMNTTDTELPQRLPNTVLVKRNTTPDDAIDDLDRAINIHNANTGHSVVRTSAIAVAFSDEHDVFESIIDCPKG